MFSKTILAVATTLVLGAAALAPTTASAHGFGGHGFHGGHGFGHGWGNGWNRGYRGFGVTLVGPSCYEYQTVMTRRGPRTVLTNICE
jgi:hypothetical protein